MGTTLVQGELRPDLPTETPNAKPAESIDQAARRDATVWELAVIIAGSRDFPECRSPEKAAVRILAGKECGIGPIASVMGIRFQNGRQSMDASLVAGVIQRSKEFAYRVKEHSTLRCVITFHAADNVAGPVGESVFSLDDAEKAGLAKKDTWRAYPRNMLFARALTNGARWYCPGLFNGAIYSHEELGYSVDEDGHATGDNAGGNGSDLCSRETRAAIRALLAEIGVTEADYCKNQGIKLLDEFSQYEADKAIKGLQKTAAKKAVKEGAKAATETAAKPAKEEPRAEVAGTGQDAAAPAPQPADADKPLSAAQQTLQDGFDESKLPSTEAQHNAIRGLAELLEIDAATMRAVIHKRAPRLADLSHLQASALIETMALKYKEATGKDSPF